MAEQPKTGFDNPFAAAMTQVQAQAQKAAEEFGRMFSAMPSMPAMPGAPDLSGWTASVQRNLEALAAANRIALEGAQAVARRQLEMVQQTIGELTETLKTLASTGGKGLAAPQAEAVKDAYSRAVAHTKELADLMQRANAEAVDVLHKRVAEALDEAKTLAAKLGKH